MNEYITRQENMFTYALMVCLIMVSMLAIPYTLAIAVLHYRLWDIDIIINRTLVYGMLSVSLAAIFLGLTFGLQFLVREITHQTNGIALVVSTLAIVALFEPLRRQIQKLYRPALLPAKIRCCQNDCCLQ